MRILPSIFAVLILTACAPRASLQVVPVAEDIGERKTVFMATTREVLADEGPDSYGRGGLRYARFEVSIPPDHQPGRINLPGRAEPDGTRHFVMSAAELDLPKRSFGADLRRAFRAQGGDGVLFVHGFSNTAAGSVFRVAQLSHDVGTEGVLLTYSWPSAGKLLGYAHDRDSVLHSRDALADTLIDIVQAGGSELNVVAHSMGSLLTMEALRTLALRGRQDVIDRLGGVVLIAPDIDVDVFRAQVASIPRLPRPMVVFTAQGDRALQLSSRISGQSNRLGRLGDIGPVQDLPIAFFDVSQFESDSSTTHFVPGSSPQMLRLLGQMAEVNDAFQRDAPARPGLLPGTVLTLQNATQIILSPVAALGGAATP